MHSTIKLALGEQFDLHGKIVYRHSASNHHQIIVQVNTSEFGVIAAFRKYFPGGRIQEFPTSKNPHRIEYTYDKALWVLRTMQKYSAEHAQVIKCALAMAQVKLTRNKDGLYTEENRIQLQVLRQEMEQIMRSRRGEVPLEEVVKKIVEDIKENGFPPQR